MIKIVGWPMTANSNAYGGKTLKLRGVPRGVKNTMKAWGILKGSNASPFTQKAEDKFPEKFKKESSENRKIYEITVTRATEKCDNEHCLRENKYTDRYQVSLVIRKRNFFDLIFGFCGINIDFFVDLLGLKRANIKHFHDDKCYNACESITDIKKQVALSPAMFVWNQRMNSKTGQLHRAVGSYWKWQESMIQSEENENDANRAAKASPFQEEESQNQKCQLQRA